MLTRATGGLFEEALRCIPGGEWREAPLREDTEGILPIGAESASTISSIRLFADWTEADAADAYVDPMLLLRDRMTRLPDPGEADPPEEETSGRAKGIKNENREPCPGFESTRS